MTFSICRPFSRLVLPYFQQKNLYNSYAHDDVEQSFLTEGSRTTFGSRAITFGSPEHLIKYYYCTIWVTKLCFILICGSPNKKVGNYWFIEYYVLTTKWAQNNYFEGLKSGLTFEKSINIVHVDKTDHLIVAGVGLLWCGLQCIDIRCIR